jgi:hypothetical protein
MEYKNKWEEIAEMTLKQGKIADKLFQKYLEESEKYEKLLSNFDLFHLQENGIEELFGFIPYELFNCKNIIRKKSEICLTYLVYKSEEDFQSDNIQEITLPLSAVDKFLRYDSHIHF